MFGSYPYAPWGEGGLRRYTTEEYGGMSEFWASFNKGDIEAFSRRRNEIENLEALYFMGFRYDYITRRYYHPYLGITLHKLDLGLPCLWNKIDKLMEEIELRNETQLSQG